MNTREIYIHWYTGNKLSKRPIIDIRRLSMDRKIALVLKHLHHNGLWKDFVVLRSDLKVISYAFSERRGSRAWLRDEDVTLNTDDSWAILWGVPETCECCRLKVWHVMVEKEERHYFCEHHARVRLLTEALRAN